MTVTTISVIAAVAVSLFIIMVFRELFFWLAGCFVFWLIGRPWK